MKAPTEYRRAELDGPPRPGVPLHHAWSTLCACCSARIAGYQTIKRGALRICADREACKGRRGHARQLWRDAGGPLDAPERIPAGSHISGVCGPAARTVRRDERRGSA